MGKEEYRQERERRKESERMKEEDFSDYYEDTSEAPASKKLRPSPYSPRVTADEVEEGEVTESKYSNFINSSIETRKNGETTVETKEVKSEFKVPEVPQQSSG